MTRLQHSDICSLAESSHGSMSIVEADVRFSSVLWHRAQLWDECKYSTVQHSAVFPILADVIKVETGSG